MRLRGCLKRKISGSRHEEATEESGIRGGSVEAGASACQEDGLLSHVSGSERQQLALLEPRMSSTAS